MKEDDVESDFLFSQADVGQPRCQAVKSKLSEMNPFCEIETIELGVGIEQIFSRAEGKSRTISAVVHGFDGGSSASASSWPAALKLN